MSEVRATDSRPRKEASAAAISNSRRNTRNQSRVWICSSASARMTSVAACDPAFPPTDRHSGTNTIRNATRSSSDSKNAIALIVTICRRNSTASQNARLFHTCQKLASR